MKRLLLFAGMFLFAVSAVRAGVGPGVAGELSITSPLMGAGQVAPALTPSIGTTAPSPIRSPGTIYSAPVRPHVVAPLPGESLHPPVVVTVGPIVQPEQDTRDLLQAPSSTPNALPSPMRPGHGLRGWLRRHHWLR